jgi:aspartyl-tRNA(Asn)/glutamyl-tRNA(Gln) amidotransferase subunit A
MPLHALSVTELGRCLREGSLTAVALAEAALARIAAADADLHAFVLVTQERARADAARADRELADGLDRGPLHGIPYALKDLIDTAGIRTTAHSRLLIDNVPPADAAVVARLADAGGVLLGKLATYEFALVGPSFDLPFPPARNPRNLVHIPGGSSSGAAAAVAAGYVRFAIGTDTGGSVRSPACYCGVVGLKPTFGRVSRHGVFPLSRSLDHVGIVAASVADAAVVLDAIAGFDRADPDSAAVPPPNATAGLMRGVEGLRLAYARRFHAGEAAADIAAGLDAAAQHFSSLGMTVEEVDLADDQVFTDCGRVILEAEAFAVHRHGLATRGADYGRLARQSLVAGSAHSAEELRQAQDLRHALTQTLLRDVFARYDGLLVANALTTAPRFDAFDGVTPRWTPMRTLAFNVTGLPALAVPMGLADDGLPIGLQIVGRPFDEAMVCRIGAAYEASHVSAGQHA